MAWVQLAFRYECAGLLYSSSGLYLSSCSHRGEIQYKLIEWCSYPLSHALFYNPSHPPGYPQQTFSRPPCTALAGALPTLKADKRVCTCRRRQMRPSLCSLERLPIPASPAQCQNLRVGGANAPFSPSSICGPPPMRQSSTHPPVTSASLLLHTLTQSLHHGYGHKCFLNVCCWLK